MGQIVKADILSVLGDSPERKIEQGALFMHSGRIMRITKIENTEQYGEQVYLEDINDSSYSWSVRKEKLFTEDYEPLVLDEKQLENFAERILNGDTLEEEKETSETALLDIHNKNTLIEIRKQTAILLKATEQIKKYAEHKIYLVTKELNAKLEVVKNQISLMNKQIKKLDYVIQTIETYAGIKEEIVQLSSGVPASAEEEVIIHQAVVFMDEEFALIDDDFDFHKMKSFDEWLVQDKNYEQIIPEQKAILAIKPRRTRKDYGEDFWVNAILNKPNFQTYFLIRNGENIYRILSEHIILEDKLFPNRDEFMSQLKKEENDVWEKRKDEDERTSARMRRRFTKVLFLLQGLFDRSDVFSPHNFTGSFMKAELPKGAKLLYELDHALTDGKPSVLTFIDNVNKNLHEGDRIVVVSGSFGKDDFCQYYRDYTEPSLPKPGIYSLEKNPFYNDGQYHANTQQPYRISYLPSDTVWDPNTGHYRNRAKKVSLNVILTNSYVMAYDNVSKEDILYYINSRYHRSMYFRYLKKMKQFLAVLEEEEKQEHEYAGLLIGQVLSKGFDFKPGVEPYKVAQEAIDRLKNRLKWKRPISSKEKETYALTTRTMLSKEFQKKYYIKKN